MNYNFQSRKRDDRRREGSTGSSTTPFLTFPLPVAVCADPFSFFARFVTPFDFSFASSSCSRSSVTTIGTFRFVAFDFGFATDLLTLMASLIVTSDNISFTFSCFFVFYIYIK